MACGTGAETAAKIDRQSVLGKSLRSSRFGNRRGGGLNQCLRFLIGQPPNQIVMGSRFPVHERFALIFGQRGHLGLGLNEELASFLQLALMEQTHGPEKARDSLKCVLIINRDSVTVASRLLRDGQRMFGSSVLAV